MMAQVYRLKSTGQELQQLTWIGKSVQPWPQAYMRVMLFINKTCHVQIVRKDNIRIGNA